MDELTTKIRQLTSARIC